MRAWSLVLLCVALSCQNRLADSKKSQGGYGSYTWWFSQDTVRSEIDDVTRLLNQRADLIGELVLSPDSSAPATLSAACQDHQLTVMINLGSEREAKDIVRMRLDSAAPENVSFFPVSYLPGSELGIALLQGSEAQKFLKRLESATWLRMEFEHPVKRIPVTVRYRVADLSGVVGPVYAACGW